MRLSTVSLSSTSAQEQLYLGSGGAATSSKALHGSHAHAGELEAHCSRRRLSGGLFSSPYISMEVGALPRRHIAARHQGYRLATAFWPVRCEDPKQAHAESLQAQAEEMAAACPPQRGKQPEPDNPLKWQVELFARQQREKAEDEMAGRREPTRHYVVKDARVAKIEAAAEKAARRRNDGEKIFRQSEYTIEKFVRGVPPWLKDVPTMFRKDKTPMPDHCKDDKNFKAKSKVGSRIGLNQSDPVQLRVRITDMATHAYYLWGQAKYITSQVGMHSPQANMARNLEHTAHEAYENATRMAQAAGIPFMKTSPRMPIYEKINPPPPDDAEAAGAIAKAAAADAMAETYEGEASKAGLFVPGGDAGLGLAAFVLSRCSWGLGLVGSRDEEQECEELEPPEAESQSIEQDDEQDDEDDNALAARGGRSARRCFCSARRATRTVPAPEGVWVHDLDQDDLPGVEFL
mmetsp:Transcript_6988/g.16971  ORF Transcript_6988/g.16971 Transcript_6988/m.16971 type:complete len:461 (-) Transcript_6988:426-1808(-)|eukprot:CAMPEP_0178996628 /NCGR_PEP_ID=MMETSP0795-20121207/8472_1 /TAXON_ID=88552 /ORGANISM="Amoebophrya sp., Strain Ameob2" /LENGTH=460 /DNA_ID=CAMNT_0020689035 /DNA_START=147 /DNA_END=1529 /DNA_ORIENTATION=+